MISVLWVECVRQLLGEGYLQGMAGSPVDRDLCRGKLERIIIAEILDQPLLGLLGVRMDVTAQRL